MRTTTVGRGRRVAGCLVLTAMLASAGRADAPATLATPTPLPLPGGAAALDLDDLQYDARLDRVLVPAAESGALDLVDPASLGVTALAIAPAAGSPASEVTSAAVADGVLFTADGAGHRLLAVDATTRQVVATIGLAAGPDYVRFLAGAGEVWVTEPRAEAIEIFGFVGGASPGFSAIGRITVAGGPEALVFDPARGRAYTNLWRAKTLAIDLAKRTEVARWDSGCADPRGLALDGQGGLLFVGCKDGTLTALDLASGEMRSSIVPGVGTDIIAFDPGRRHLYAPAGKSATLAVVGVSALGELTLLATGAAAEHAHCVTTDLRGGIYVCDPGHGRLLVFRDELPAQR